jgi:hypothetical protein
LTAIPLGSHGALDRKPATESRMCI